MQITQLTAFDLLDQIKKRQLTARDAVEAFLKQIDKHEKTIGALITVLPEYARERADQIDQMLADGRDAGPLAGLPIIIKDNLCTQFAKTTCASKILIDYQPPYNAHVVEQLEKAGAIIIAKANLDEFAMGSSTENSGIKTTRNPWSTDCVPGGSSGGSAAAVAARMAPVSLGTDTGGSIRLPAAFCGISGLKPTYGRVSRYGLVAYGSSLDQIGPLGADARDIALVMNVISGHDARDTTSVPESISPKPDYLTKLDTPLKGLRIGIVKEYQSSDGIDPQIVAAIDQATKLYEQMGAQLVEVSLPHTQYAVACYYLVATAEASSNLARYDGVHFGYRTPNPEDYIDVYSSSRAEGFGDEVKRRIMLGTYALSAGYYDAYYLKALKVRMMIRQDFEKAFEQADIICAPVAPTTAFRVGEKTSDPLTMYLSDIFTISANLAGIPGISIPAGFSRDSLPIGLQLLGNYFDESTILQAAWQYQQHTDFHRQIPAGFIEQ
ncbi:MAG: Asp-tRNA(Asn)/Glu-tRNA(Gln) amidotransferase subunit GatA [Phycisphaerae bacterium]|jgi:aspartyl-tRNA(Asn)/glutamyl-tRNA(Gln) amidotransferase subunit A|nr:Asp-tRNA(Asn)/Glu-tRNA(Gln) amidotransferase subunit GatA [Phycisphaerae bacterium]